MDVKRLHPWALPPKEAIALQRELAGEVNCTRDLDVSMLRIIAGVDVSCTRFSPLLTAGVVVWDADTGRILETAFVEENGTFPYIPGLLSFREIPSLSRAIEQLKIRPDLFLVDGQGIAHPRGMGIAAHLGLLIDVPTVGVAKSLLCGETAVPAIAGASAPILYHDKTVGMALRPKAKANPIYVSPGNGISIISAVDAVKKCLRGYRLPEPTRLAHLHVNAARTTGHGLPVSQEALL